MNIAYACDNNFVDVMCVSIMSFNDHNCDANIYILDCGIESDKKIRILELCSGKNTVFFIDAKKTLDSLDYNLNLDRGSIAAYARLFIGSMLPDAVDKALYIDCDTLIRKPLAELYNTDIFPYIIGGIRDAFSVINKRVFGIKKGDLLVNSGVLLISVEQWRARGIEKKVYEIIDKDIKIFQGDQGIINTIFHGNVYELPLQYDVMTYIYDFTYEELMFYRKPDNYFGRREIKKAKEEPYIVHFSSSYRSYRPWETDSNAHPYFDEWNYYYLKVCEREKIKKKNKVKMKKKLQNRPVLFIIRIIHAYLRPLLFLIKNRDY